MADTLHGFGLGVASKNSRGEILDVYYPAPLATISESWLRLSTA